MKIDKRKLARKSNRRKVKIASHLFEHFSNEILRRCRVTFWVSETSLFAQRVFLNLKKISEFVGWRKNIRNREQKKAIIFFLPFAAKWTNTVNCVPKKTRKNTSNPERNRREEIFIENIKNIVKSEDKKVLKWN